MAFVHYQWWRKSVSVAHDVCPLSVVEVAETVAASEANDVCPLSVVEVAVTVAVSEVDEVIYRKCSHAKQAVHTKSSHQLASE